MGMQRLKKPFSQSLAGRADRAGDRDQPRNRSPRTSDLSVTSGSVARTEPGSYRDPANRVFYLDDRVLRGLGTPGAAAWRSLQGTRFFPKLLADGRVVRTVEVAATSLGVDTDAWELVVEHERIPFVSYPYEWPFSMLRDAAELHLELLLAALDESFTMSDGYAYNVQWQGTRPVFIDVGSFQPSEGGGPWAGYRQFCQTFLFPLMLQGHRGVAYRPLLRGQVDGITPAQASRLFSRGDWVRPGVFRHAVLHDLAERRFSADSTQQVKAQLRSAGFDQELVKAVAAKLLRLVRKVTWEPSGSGWSGYGETCTYDAAGRAAKQAFVDAAVRAAPPARVRPRLQRRHLQPGGGRARRPRRGGRR